MLRDNKQYIIGGCIVAALVFVLIWIRNKKKNASLNASPVQRPNQPGLDEELSADVYNRLYSKHVDMNGIAFSHRNPGNLRWFGADWVGLDRKNTKAKGDFCWFLDVESGTRAMTKLIQNYLKDGVNTIDKIVSKYAPAQDGNVPTKYADFIEQKAGVSRSQILALSDVDTMARILYYMHIMEAGFAWVDYSKFVSWYQSLLNS